MASSDSVNAAQWSTEHEMDRGSAVHRVRNRDFRSSAGSTNRANRGGYICGIHLQCDVQFALATGAFQACRLLECTVGRCKKAVLTSLHSPYVEISVLIRCRRLRCRLLALGEILSQFHTRLHQRRIVTIGNAAHDVRGLR